MSEKRKFYFKKNKEGGGFNTKKKNKTTNVDDLNLEMVPCPLCENNFYDKTDINKEEINEDINTTTTTTITTTTTTTTTNTINNNNNINTTPTNSISSNDENIKDNKKIKIFSKRLNKLYYGCGECGLVYMHPHFHVENSKEKDRYELHKNSPTDEKYKSFLLPCVEKLKDLLEKELKEFDDDNDKKEEKKNQFIGLDYGCGPGPTLSLMFKEITNFNVENYDPYFMKHEMVEKVEKNLKIKEKDEKDEKNKENEENKEKEQIEEIKPFKFITCTEAIEHFKYPIKDLKKIIDGNLISKDGGYLLIMTQLLLNDEMFENWHYPRDFTHICFFRPKTFNWIAEKFNAKLLELDQSKGISILFFDQ
ncbi:hypothetical protein RB653_002089 [Dictyostelium firmibasis]|uniref:Uncharacterized protein n=1 Tax=Dictyostelium firmibasis TaxID=79012 RepID=A0AAN7TWC8_9MYCE